MSFDIRNPYGHLARVCLIIGIILLVVGVVSCWFLYHLDPTFTSHEIGVLISVLTICISFGFLFAVIMLWVVSRSIATTINRIKAGESLIHWSYSTEEWSAFQSKEIDLSKIDFRKSPIFQFLPYLPAGILIFLLIAYLDKGVSIRDAVIIATGTCAFFAFIIPLSYYFRVVRVNAYRRRILNVPSETFLDLDYGYASGKIFFSRLFQQQVVRVQLLDVEPRCIEFVIRMNTPKTGEIDELYRVLVPAGDERRAEEYVEAMQNRWSLN